MYKIVGVDMMNTACDCCGREDLKMVIILRGPNGDVRFGRGCAARAMGHRRTARDIAQIATDRTVTELRQDAYRFGNAPIGRLGYGDVRTLTDGRLYSDTAACLTAAEVQAAYPDREWVRLNKTSWVTAA